MYITCRDEPLLVINQFRQNKGSKVTHHIQARAAWAQEHLIMPLIPINSCRTMEEKTIIFFNTLFFVFSQLRKKSIVIIWTFFSLYVPKNQPKHHTTDQHSKWTFYSTYILAAAGLQTINKLQIIPKVLRFLT